MAANWAGTGEHFDNLIELLRARTAEHGSRIAFRFLSDGDSEKAHFTYQDLELSARAIAASLARHSAAGERALLFYPAGPEFIAGFWGCLYAGVVAVPVFPARLQRHLPRLQAIAADAEAKFVLTTGKILSKSKELFKRAPDLQKLQWLATDDAPGTSDEEWHDLSPNLETLALLQYTSGSTAAPRGVVVTHGNLLHNLSCLRDIFQFSEKSVGVTWLPHYHDMGLVGGLLQPVYAGGEMIVMPPSSFLQRPVRWLDAVTRYRATTMVAPNFAYDLCVRKIPPGERAGLELSAVNIALCGAEPVRSETLEQFAEAFGPYGFRQAAFRPAYGLAEATLIVSGRSEGGAPYLRTISPEGLQRNCVELAKGDAAARRTLVGCGGTAPGLRALIVDPETLSPCAANQIGEIWVCGPSVANGYWRKPQETQETFGARLASGEGPFLRTGDFGFLDEGRLFVTGRRKDLIIIRGSNHYPQDLENTVQRSHSALRVDSGAAFSIDADGAERLVIVQELEDGASAVNEDVVDAIRRALSDSHEVQPDAVVLIAPRSISRTSSGKIQRYACREAFLSGTLDVVYEWRESETSSAHDDSNGSKRRSGLIWDYLSKPSLSHRLAGKPNGHENGNSERAARSSPESKSTEPIAIVGLACRFPGAANLEEFWHSLRNGVDAITEIPPDRWDVDALYDPVPGTIGKMSTRWGGFLSGLDRFDPHFFGISPREAAGMDPQQRLLLEVTWEALENAAQPPDKLAGTRTGVFVGIGGFDYSNVMLNYEDHLKTINAYLGTGNAHSIAANRISYLLDLRGPSVSIDTACSSSLVAIHMACESLRSAESNLALAGAVNLILSPEVTIAFSHAHMMAADGRCKTFDAKADGYVRAEGCGIAVLKRLSDALRDRDNILALIRGSAVNQDGRTAGIAAPNGTAQQSVIREALAQAEISPRELTYIEAHGTGTSIGDPIEIEAVKGVLGKSEPGDLPCLVGSVKANIGHAENASGMAGLAKVVNCLQHEEIPGQLHFSKLNPRISVAGTRIVIPREPQPWPRAPRRLAGISSFGFGGTNAHIVVEDRPERPRTEGLPSRPSQILTLSARTESALKSMVRRFEQYLAELSGENLADICFSANAGRSHFAHRLAVVANSPAQLREALAAFMAGEDSHGSAARIWTGHVMKKEGPRVAFLFGDQPIETPAAFELYETQPVFREAIDQCARIVNLPAERSLLSALAPEDTDSGSRDSALFALEYALAVLWQSWGIKPDVVLGAGVSEYAAAVIAGVLSCEDALKLIRERARILQLAFQDGELEQALDEFESAAGSVPFHSLRIPLVSGLTGQLIPEDETLGAAYWRQQLNQSPKLEAALKAAARGCDCFLEIGPACSFVGASSTTTSAAWLSSLDPQTGATESLLKSLAALYLHGANIDWTAFDEPYEPMKLPLPAYPFERERCWEDPYGTSGKKMPAKPQHPLLAGRLLSALPMAQFQTSVGIQTHRYLKDHRVHGSAIFPAAAYLEMARAAASELFGDGPAVLSNVAFQEALILPSSGERTLQLVASPASSGSASFQIYSSNLNSNGSHTPEWTLHASGDMRVERADAVQPESEENSLEELRARCPERKSSSELYEALRSAGLKYGPSFQGVEELWCGLNEALGEVRLPSVASSNPQANGRSDGYWIHPALLDSCLHVVAAALPEDAVDSRRGMYLPSGVATVRFFSRPSVQLYAHSTTRPSDRTGEEFFDADVRLFDEHGQLAAELLGFRMKRVAAEADQEKREDPNELVYDVTWVPKRIAASQLADRAEPTSWLILADRGGVGQSLCAQLESQGQTCTIASLDNPPDAESVQNFSNVVHFSSLDLGQDDNGSEGLLQAQNSWLKTLQFVQMLLHHSNGSKRRLWIVTRGAQTAGSSAVKLSLAQTPLWGLAKSLDLEHPELGCTRIDLDPAGGPAEVSALAAELSLPPSEREVAFRKGSRYVARLGSRAGKLARGTLLEIPLADSFHLDISRPGNLDSLTLRGSSRSKPKPGEVEIRVHAAGLNFRDVMNAAGVYPGGPIPFGAECSGMVSAVGLGVEDIHVGDEVIALASGSFGLYVTTDARAVVPKPPAFSFGQAATIPIAFLTAYYSLHHLAKLSRGERVLIHAAAGGVGLAAVQLALRAGAEVFVTAGAPEKRAFLKSMRVRHVFDSRSLDFADEIMTKTNGQGVDVVLNSLPGEYIARSLSLLSAYGRFVEIGKTDIYQNKPLGLFPFRNNLSYFALDLDRVCRERPEIVRSMLLELLEMFKQGALQPLHHQIFLLEDAINAFRHMARRKNIGKVVLSLPEPGSKSRTPRALSVRNDASYLITGGHGGLGLVVARWLVEKGARHLVLLGRSGTSVESARLTAELAARGVTAKTIQADVSNESDLARALSQIRGSLPPLRGVIHAAGVLDDRAFLNQDPESFQRVLAPKVLGAWNLHTLTKDLPLDFFILFSSVASVLGSPGQGNYSAANAFLDALAHDRRACRLPALSINWGPWDEVGMAARASNSRGVASRVMQPLAPAQALGALDRLFERSGPAQAVVMSVDWTWFARSLNGNQPPALISDLIREKALPSDGKGGANSGPRLSAQELFAVAPAQRHALLLSHIRKSLAQVLNVDAKDLDSEESLSNLGLDSLMALELQHSLEESLGAKLPIELLLGMPTLNEFVARVLESIPQPGVSPDSTVSPTAVDAKPEPRENLPPHAEA